MTATCRIQPATSPQIALALTLALAATSTIAAQQSTKIGNSRHSAPATVEQPRPFGYVVGDIVTQRVLLPFEPSDLPVVQRVSIWFERRAPRIETASDGRRWLVVDYQLINSPPKLTSISLPAWQIEDKAQSTQLTIPAAPISVSPLIPEAASAELRPDREVSIIDTAATRMSLFVWSIALAVTLAAWLSWAQLRNWRDSHNRPFARALREVQRIGETAPEAWQALHRAFDQTAGRVLQIETLPALFERAPYLQPQRADIERFFAQSNERFFGTGSQSNPLSIGALCHELRRIERRQAP